MPFDGVGFAFEDRVSKIDKVIDLLATPDKWCKGNLRTSDGRYCVRGALMAVDGGINLQAIVLRAIREVTGKHYLRIESFNDRSETDHAEVLAVLRRARDRLINAEVDPDHCTTSVGWCTRMRALLKGFRATEPA
jgi:hypothetical protein